MPLSPLACIYITIWQQVFSILGTRTSRSTKPNFSTRYSYKLSSSSNCHLFITQFALAVGLSRDIWLMEGTAGKAHHSPPGPIVAAGNIFDEDHGKRQANVISMLSPTPTQSDVDPIFFSQISSPPELLIAPEPAAHSQSKTWKSSDTKEKDQYARLSTLLYHFVPESPFVPRTYAVWIQHRAFMNAMDLDNMRNDIAARQSRSTIATRMSIKPLLEGKAFTDNRSAVLSQETIWATWSVPTDDHPEALWPDRTEFQYEGDDRARSAVGRFLPLPRKPGNETVNWKAREHLQPYQPLDHVGMLKDDEISDIGAKRNSDGWQERREHEEIVGKLLGEELITELG